MDNIKDLILSSYDIAITSHSDEDADAFGSSMALRLALMSLGKNVDYYVSLPLEHRLQFFPKDYIIYDEEKHTKKYDLCICLDSADEKRLGKRIKLKNEAKKTINIDHHYTNTRYAMENRVGDNMSSTGEMIYDLLIEMNIEITKEIATYLYCAIMGDTSCLKYSSATPKTVMIISKLMECGIDHADLSRRLFDTEKITSIKLKGYIMNNIKSFYDGEVSLVSIDEEKFLEYGVLEKDVGDIVNIPRSVEGTQIAVSLRQVPEKVKISLRSNGKYNVGEIAQKLGGGGHMMAAGIGLFGATLADAEEKILKVIGDYINGWIW